MNAVPQAPAVSILMYHQVGEFPSPKAHRACFCHVRRFANQMRYLQLFGYSVISLDAAYKGLFEGAPLPQRPVVLTFDDGYENFREYAWPILQRYGFPASVFLVTERLGKPAGWLDDGGSNAPLMSPATIRALHREGVHFGSHSLSHPRLSKIDPARMQAEIIDSKRSLEDLLGVAVPDFCYPYGDYDTRVRDTVAEAGYRLGLTCIRGAANTADNALEIPRKAISYGDNLAGYVWKLHMKHARKGKKPADAYA